MKPPARLLDITRSLRRAGRIPTGVDRVERAYWRALLEDDVPTFGLARTRFGYLLFDESGLRRVLTGLEGSNAIFRARLAAFARTPPFGLRRMLQRRLPRGTSYLNVGHSNITPRVYDAVKHGCAGQITTFVHDVIPVEHSDLQRPETSAQFAKKLDLVLHQADRVIVNSADTLNRLKAYAPDGELLPTGSVAHLGIDMPEPAEAPHLMPQSPYFLAIGTIEPRKNHALLLDVWDALGSEAPILVICGARGWADQSLFDRLDAAKKTGRVIEHNTLPDAEIAALLTKARALLFPSLAEGFGLPAIEAAAMGAPVIANDLPVLREVLGNIPIYASVDDRYLWTKYVKEYATAGPIRDPKPFQPPTWQAHFKTVLSVA